MPIQDIVVIVRKDGENDEEKLEALFTSTSLRHPVAPHRLVINIGEVVEPTISLDIATRVLKVWGPDIQNGLIIYKHLDEELASLYKIWTVELGKKMKEWR